MKTSQRMIGTLALCLAIVGGNVGAVAAAPEAAATVTEGATESATVTEGASLQMTRVSDLTAVEFYQRFGRLCEEASQKEGATVKIAPTMQLRQMLPEEVNGKSWQNYIFTVQLNGDQARTDDQGTVQLLVGDDNYVSGVVISAPQANEDVAYASVTASLGALGLTTDEAMPLLEGALSSRDQRAIIETQETLGRSIGLAGELNGDTLWFTIYGFVE